MVRVSLEGLGVAGVVCGGVEIEVTRRVPERFLGRPGFGRSADVVVVGVAPVGSVSETKAKA